MRLFIALDFPNIIKTKLNESALYAKSILGNGNYTLIDNYHITLAFIGEADENEKNKIIEILKTIKFTPSEISINKFDCFNNENEMIVIRKIFANKFVMEYRKKLIEKLSFIGYNINSRFIPHITIARRVESRMAGFFSVLNNGLENIKFLQHKVTLFNSERINGRLTYTPLFIAGD